MKIYVAHDYETHQVYSTLEAAVTKSSLEYINEYRLNSESCEFESTEQIWMMCPSGSRNVAVEYRAISKKDNQAIREWRIGCGKYFEIVGYVQTFCDSCNEKYAYERREHTYRENHPLSDKSPAEATA